jgi:hypothetical protein
VSNVDVANLPITTVAKGRWTSAPALVANIMGMKPRLATSAVINTGRSRMVPPSTIVLLFGIQSIKVLNERVYI